MTEPQDVQSLNLVINGEVDKTQPYGFKRCEFKAKTFNLPLIEKIEEYYVLCERLVVPMALCPKLIFRINEGITQTDKNQGVIQFQMKYFNNVYTSFVNYIPNNDFTVIPPSQNGGKQDFSNPYYFINNYTQLCAMLNATIDSLYVLLNTDFPGVFTAGGLRFIWNIQNEAFQLIYNSSYVNANFTLSTNVFLRNILSGFPFYLALNSQINIPFVFQLTILPLNANLYATNYYFIQNDSSTIISYVNCLNMIYVVSNTLPINPEYIMTDSSFTKLSFQNIIFSFRPDKDMINNSISELIYTPDSRDKIIGMTRTGDINTLDYSLYWTDELGNIFPIYISPDCQSSMKLTFIKKDLYKIKMLK